MTTDENVPTSAGLSSFNLLDEQKLFSALALQTGATLLDYGCGAGNYAVAAAPRIGNRGRIYAVDLWEEGIETLEVRATMAGLQNIQAWVCGAGAQMHIEEQSVDVCLMATVIHILVQEGLIRGTLREIQRVLRPGGIVAAVEFHKKKGPPGPPLSWRLAPADLADVLAGSGLRIVNTFEVGPHNYLSLFSW